MSFEDKKSNIQKNQQLTLSNDNIASLSKEEEKSDNNQLIKPIPINPKLITKQKSGATTLGNSSVTINNINQESCIPIGYPQYNIHFPQIQNSNLEYNNKLNYFQSKKFESNEKIEYNKNLLEPKDKPCCSCTKTKCIKKYCECFANKRFCKDCHCQDCMNRFSFYSNNNNNIRYLTENDKITCTCTKSNCNKKYCECYKAGKKCNDKCRCLNCMNSLTSSTYIINNNNNLDENNDNKNNEPNNSEITIKDKYIKKNSNLEDIKTSSRKSSSSLNLNNGFKIQRISVFINKNQTLIDVEKFSKEDMNLLSKKRNHN